LAEIDTRWKSNVGVVKAAGDVTLSETTYNPPLIDHRGTSSSDGVA